MLTYITVFTSQFEHHSNDFLDHTNFTSLLSKDFPYFSYIYKINSKTQLCLRPNSSQIALFPIKTTKNLIFTTTPRNPIFPTVPHTCFSTKFRTIFNFMELFTNDRSDTCATIIQNSTNHVAILPTGNIGYIKVPITNGKPKYYQVHDNHSLVHNVAHEYNRELTEPIVPTTYVSY